jgi:hypothetical protein
MTDELIIQQLKDKEAQLLNDLNKVRLALKAFIEENIPFGNASPYISSSQDLIPKTYGTNLTWGSKILFILYTESRPMLVDDIVSAIQSYEPGLDIDKLHKNVSHNLSMLAKYSKIKKHPFNRKIKYSLQ